MTDYRTHVTDDAELRARAEADSFAARSTGGGAGPEPGSHTALPAWREGGQGHSRPKPDRAALPRLDLEPIRPWRRTADARHTPAGDPVIRPVPSNPAVVLENIRQGELDATHEPVADQPPTRPRPRGASGEPSEPERERIRSFARRHAAADALLGRHQQRAADVDSHRMHRRDAPGDARHAAPVNAPVTSVAPAAVESPSDIELDPLPPPSVDQAQEADEPADGRARKGLRQRGRHAVEWLLARRPEPDHEAIAAARPRPAPGSASGMTEAPGDPPPRDPTSRDSTLRAADAISEPAPIVEPTPVPEGPVVLEPPARTELEPIDVAEAPGLGIELDDDIVDRPPVSAPATRPHTEPGSAPPVRRGPAPRPAPGPALLLEPVPSPTPEPMPIPTPTPGPTTPQPTSGPAVPAAAPRDQAAPATGNRPRPHPRPEPVNPPAGQSTPAAPPVPPALEPLPIAAVPPPAGRPRPHPDQTSNPTVPTTPSAHTAAEPDTADATASAQVPAAAPPGEPSPFGRTHDPDLSRFLEASEPQPGDDEKEKRTEPGALRRFLIRRRRGLIVSAVIVVVAGVAALLLRAYVVAPYYIPSASMEPTLHGCPGCNDDHILVDKISYRLHDPRRQDVVVFDRPQDAFVSEKVLIKRIVGLPGEKVRLMQGLVYIDGAPLDEPYLRKQCGARPSTPHGSASSWTIPAGEYFVMGDNRCNSTDSRDFGPIKKSSVVGRAWLIVWPLRRISTL